MSETDAGHDPVSDHATGPARLTRDQCRTLDELAERRLGIPGLLLMENAGINAAGALLDLLAGERSIGPEQARVIVFAGGGNNGGDGFVVARHLHTWGADARVVAAKRPAEYRGDAAVNARICERFGLEIQPLAELPELDSSKARPLWDRWNEHDAWVDALLGTGFTGAVREDIANLIRGLNDRPDRPLVLAIDTPSGLDCQSGVPADPTVRADLTVTFVAEKVGFDRPDAAAVLGRTVVAEIGVPPWLVAEVASGQADDPG